ncbi:MAG: hypothetical protein GY820_15085 [Gammaproteobacteria bacterium]|nr:hypothetical protein [Gammaproteobacteria bacterium]
MDTRTFSWWDLLANLSGILIFSGIAVSYYFQSRRYCRGNSKSNNASLIGTQPRSGEASD